MKQAFEAACRHNNVDKFCLQKYNFGSKRPKWTILSQRYSYCLAAKTDPALTNTLKLLDPDLSRRCHQKMQFRLQHYILLTILWISHFSHTVSWSSMIKPFSNMPLKKNQMKRIVASTVGIFFEMSNIIILPSSSSSSSGSAVVVLDAEAESLYRKARQVENEGDFILAQSLYEQIVISYPEYTVAWSDLGNVLTTRGNLDQALLCYKKALSLKPDRENLSLILLNKAAIEQGLNKADDALRDLEIAERVSGTSSVLTANKAVVLSNLGQWRESCALFEQIISTADRNALPWWLRYSMALLETGRGMESLAFFQRTFNRFPDETEIKAFAVALYTSLGTKNEALRYWDKISDVEKEQYKNVDAFVVGKLHWGPTAVDSFKVFLKTLPS